MERIADICLEEGFPYTLLKYISAETYYPENLADFIRNRKNIIPTRTILPLGVFLYGKALVILPSAMYFPINKRKGILRDFGNEIEVSISELRPRRLEELQEQTHLRDVRLVYIPGKDSIHLYSFKK